MKNKYFDIAMNAAKLSNVSKYQVGCVVVYKNKILNSACNSNKTHPLQKIYNKERFSNDTPHKLHAEIKALIPLIKYNINWNKVDIYILRKKANNKVGMARPCPSCMSFIKTFKIKNIYYTTDSGFSHEIIIY